MTDLKSDFLKSVTERGYMHQCTGLEDLDKKATEGIVTAYIGFDCTAPSLHVGSLLPIMMLRTLQKTGHKPIVLMGGGTTLVGDPSGKDESRKLLTEDVIQSNMDSIKKVFAKFLKFGDGPTDAVMVNNADWLKSLNYLEFLRDFGPHFTINRMMGFDSVKLRLEREQPLTFLEFNYMILQAYDFLALNRTHGCNLQMGGSDQWGNIISGVELTRRVDGKEAYGLTTPLLTTSSGAKMGKTAAGAVWLNEEQLSPYDYWQYWRNTEDADVGKFLRLFTELPLAEIERLEAFEGQEINEAKKVLANEVTKMLHGETAAKTAHSTAEKTFEQGQLGQDLPTVDVERAKLEDGIAAFSAFMLAGLAGSGGDAKRLIKGGGARINDKAVSDISHTVSVADLNDDGVIKMSAGKKRHVLLRAI
ncbi:MAG: tyrosine--tRNA ligase [Rhodospirillaceae bacterium]|nr:MAG: tyrosine--tRNA ligase [Rhodospirillaceae bacterium]